MGSGDARPVKVLIADSAKLVRLLLVELLHDCPFPVSVTEVSDGTDACRLLLSGNFDIAFLEAVMPGIDGLSALELSHRMQSQPFTIIFSTVLDDSKRLKARRFGAYECLKKPFTTKQIFKLLRSYQSIKSPYRALVVDDSDTIRTIVDKLLQKSFFNVDIEEASDGQSAIDVCKDRPFDIVFLDVVMPGLSGLEVLRELRRQNNETNIILMTAQKDFVLTDEIKSLGTNIVLRKPFTHFEVNASLHTVWGIDQPDLGAPPAKPPPKAEAVHPLKTEDVHYV